MKTAWTLCLLTVAACWSAAAEAGPIPTAPIYTSKPRFRIPFRYDPAEMQALGAKEIRLYMSRDRGANWQQIQTVAPDAGKFNFQAPADGEYWFVVRTLDIRGRLHPEGAIVEPGLQVVVDSVQPQLRLELRQPAAGKVQLSWLATDDHLDPTQLRLEYIQPGQPVWQTVSVVPKAVGQTEWSVPQGGIVAVRGTISDFAKNIGQDQAQVQIAPADQTVPRPAVPDFREPIASPGVRGDNDLALTLPGQFPSAPAAAPLPMDSAGAQQLPQFAPIRSLDMPGQPQMGTAPRNSFVSQTEPFGGRPGAGNPNDPMGTAAGGDGAQTQVGRYRIVNSRQFQIGYKLQDVGPSGVSNVELFITQNDGANWFRYGVDDDNQSPFHVEVPKEGVYGFALGVQSGAGLGSEPPRAGDKPSIIVVVDQTPPQLELLPLEQGRGRAFNKILIQWRFQDEHPAEKPIAVSYSATGQGPWQPITGWIENTESHVWTLGPGVPTKFYLRVEARDQAGNLQVVETPQPVLVDLSRPTAKIIDVEAGTGPLGPQ